MGYEVHETLLGIRNGKLVVACKDFCKEPGALREIRTLKNIYNKDLQYQLELSGSLSNTKGHVVNLEELLIHLQYNPILSQVHGITERFWECAVIDCLINNNDRNNGNWGVLLENDSYRLAPIYDNGASFSNKLSQNQIERILNDEGRMLQSIRGSRTAYGEGDKDYTAEELLAREDFGMKEALKKTVPLIQEKMSQIKQVIDEIPESYKGIEICSPYLKEFYKTITEKRMDYLLLPALRRVKIREDIINND